MRPCLWKPCWHRQCGEPDRLVPLSCWRKRTSGLFQTFFLLWARFGGAEVAYQFGQQFYPVIRACEEALEQGKLPGRECRERLQGALEHVLTVVPVAEVQQALSRLEDALGEDTLRAAEALGLWLRIS